MRITLSSYDNLMFSPYSKRNVILKLYLKTFPGGLKEGLPLLEYSSLLVAWVQKQVHVHVHVNTKNRRQMENIRTTPMEEPLTIIRERRKRALDLPSSKNNL